MASTTVEAEEHETIGVLFGCFARKRDGPGLPGDLIIYRGHLFPLKWIGSTGIALSNFSEVTGFKTGSQQLPLLAGVSSTNRDILREFMDWYLWSGRGNPSQFRRGQVCLLRCVSFVEGKAAGVAERGTPPNQRFCVRVKMNRKASKSTRVP